MLSAVLGKMLMEVEAEQACPKLGTNACAGEEIHT